MASVEDVLGRLRAKARPDQIEGMARYVLAPEGRLGVSVPELRKLAKELGKDHFLALELWQTGVAEARMLAAMIDEPGQLTAQQMDDWVKDFNSWDLCDQVCMNLYEKSPLAWTKIHEWSGREEEFVKRAAFALIACLAWHDKTVSDQQFIEVLPVIKRGATDNRNYVRKAVSWALRNIGKRNGNLHRIALQWAEDIRKLDVPAARWIAADAIADLQSDVTRRKLAKMEGAEKRPGMAS